MDLVKLDLTYNFLWLSFLFGIRISIKGKISVKTTLETPYVKNLHILCRYFIKVFLTRGMERHSFFKQIKFNIFAQCSVLTNTGNYMTEIM